MGRQRSVGEVGQVVPQSALSVKNPSDQSKAQTPPKQRLSRVSRTNARWKKPIVEDVHPPAPHKLDWDTERERPSKHSGNQKENHYLCRHGGRRRGEVGAPQSKPRSPTDPSKAQNQTQAQPGCRRARRKAHFKWRKKRAAVETPPVPPPCEQQHLEGEDWEQEISGHAGDQEDDQDSPYGIEDVMTVALMRLNVKPAWSGLVPTLYNPSIHHMPQVRWEYGSRTMVAATPGQFSDVED